MLFYLSLLFGCMTAEPAIVTTEQGQVQGVLTDDNYYVFHGIYYAGSVSGGNRFKAAPPPLSYPGIFQAVEKTVICAHPTPMGIVGQEDCLVLNIYTNNMTTLKPVMVVLLGDEYSSINFKNYSYIRLVEYDMVVVTMNYRLSIFGFLCLGVPEAPGNAGLKDVVQGLTWLKNNIAGFGGDPNNVVLFGHGSGAAMVDLITMSPLASDLVHKAVTLSGSSLAAWAVAYEPVKYAKAFAELLGYKEDTLEGLASALVTTNISQLDPALQDFTFLNNSVLFAPCIENPNLYYTFLAEAPIDLIQSGRYNHIPLIAGYTDREGTIRAAEAVNDGWLTKMQVNFEDFIPVDLELNATFDKSHLAATIKTFYWQNRPLNMTTIKNYLNFHGDTVVVIPVIRGARERAAFSTASVFLIEFTYRGTRNSDWQYPQIKIDGVEHGGLLNYLFDYDLKEQGRDDGARDSILRRFVSFAHTGEPTNGREYWLPISSSAIFGTAFYYLHYGGDSETDLVNLREQSRSNPHSASLTLWDNLYDAYYARPLEPIWTLINTTSVASSAYEYTVCKSNTGDKLNQTYS